MLGWVGGGNFYPPPPAHLAYIKKPIQNRINAHSYTWVLDIDLFIFWWLFRTIWLSVVVSLIFSFICYVILLYIYVCSQIIDLIKNLLA